jgi:tripartite-type tricarboxylate transporter receptor subunit TctC
LAELGVTGFDVDLWYGVLAPAGTPKDIIDRLMPSSTRSWLSRMSGLL